MNDDMPIMNDDMPYMYDDVPYMKDDTPYMTAYPWLERYHIPWGDAKTMERGGSQPHLQKQRTQKRFSKPAWTLPHPGAIEDIRKTDYGKDQTEHRKNQ